MQDVCYDVEVEMSLQFPQCEFFIQKTTSTDENATLDIKAPHMGVLVQQFFLQTEDLTPVCHVMLKKFPRSVKK